MPAHDWTKLYDGAFHAFHLAWIAKLQEVLNGGILPPDYYAMAEQVAGPAVPDVLTLQAKNGFEDGWTGEPVSGAVAVATAPPRVSLSTAPRLSRSRGASEVSSSATSVMTGSSP